MGNTIDIKALGVEFRRARLEREIKQETLARESEYSQAFISLVEKGEKEVTLRLVHVYADLTGREDLRMRAFGVNNAMLVEMAVNATRYQIAQQLMHA